MRVVAGSDVEVLSPVFVGPDGETAATLDATPTCTVVDGAGTALAAPVVTSAGVGIYAAALTAAVHTALLDTLTLTWTGTVGGKVQRATQTVQVAGGVFVALSTLRQVPALDNTDKYPTATLRMAREEFEEIAEQYLKVAFVPRAARETITGTGQCHLVLAHPMPRAIRSITVDGTTVDVATVRVDDAGWITRGDAWPRGSVVDHAGSRPGQVRVTTPTPSWGSSSQSRAGRSPCQRMPNESRPNAVGASCTSMPRPYQSSGTSESRTKPSADSRTSRSRTSTRNRADSSTDHDHVGVAPSRSAVVAPG